jgi:PBSX family phage terminase large subunit
MPLSLAQANIANDDKRFRVVIAGRRFGKTHISIREICKAARIPDREVWYVAPTYRQSKQIVWKKLKHKLQDLRWTAKVNESELAITLKNGTTIALKGADNADSLRGVGLDFIVLDEFADIDPEAWYEVLRPTLSDKQGSALFIGTPKGIGNWAHDLYNMSQESPEDWSSHQYTTIDGGNVPESEIESAKRDLDTRTFNQEYMATFETYSGRIFYNFDRKIHVKKYEYTAIPDVLYIGMDFNIDPMSAVVFARHKDTLHAIDEIRLFSSNTSEIVDEIKARYGSRKIWVYPDPASRQRKTSAGGFTDLTILQNAGFIVKAPNSHNPVRDGINAVNSRLLNDRKEVNLLFDPRCKSTIESMEKYSYKENSSQPDKDKGYDHMADALRYAVDYMFPIKKDTSDIVQPKRWGHQTTGVYA